MATSTRAGLVTLLGEWSTYTDITTDQYGDFIAWAHEEIGRRLRARVMLASETATVNSETLALPTRFAAIRSFYLGTTTRTALKVVSPENVHELIGQAASQTYPEVVAVEGNGFRFGPTFTGSATGYLLFYQKPAALVASTDTNDVLTNYPFLYVYGAMEALHMFKEDDEQADRWGQKFGALIEDINRRDAADAYSGPLMSRIPPQGIV